VAVVCVTRSILVDLRARKSVEFRISSSDQRPAGAIPVKELSLMFSLKKCGIFSSLTLATALIGCSPAADESTTTPPTTTTPPATTTPSEPTTPAVTPSTGPESTPPPAEAPKTEPPKDEAHKADAPKDDATKAEPPK